MSDDRRLIAECLEGRTSAFTELVRRYQDRLYRPMHRLLHNAEDAQDAVQEAFFLAYQSLRRFRGHSDFYTWLYRIAVNAAISLKRKQRSTVSVDSGFANGRCMDLPDRSRTNHPGTALEIAETLRQFHHALGRLTPRDRDLLTLIDLEGNKYNWMARQLKVPVGTIRSRLHRARRKLRKLLRAGGVTDHDSRA
ncbi:MAG: sigma-70 family RNA polymerase sigma factor [Planctomycetes bacterium]|nr:sigma-70 family RNA polymerase sigma factor [Planctomycetota bacterium]